MRECASGSLFIWDREESSLSVVDLEKLASQSLWATKNLTIMKNMVLYYNWGQALGDRIPCDVHSVLQPC